MSAGESSPIPGKHFQAILDRITDGFFALDRSWCFTYVNQPGTALFRRSREELIGNHIWTVFPDAVGTRFQHEYEGAMATGKTVVFTEYYAPYGGWFEIRVYPSDSGLTAYMRDVTEQQRVQEELRTNREELRRQFSEIETLYRSAPVGLCVLDRELRYVRINDCLARMNGRSAAEHIGRTPREVIPDVADQVEEIARRVLLTGRPILNRETRGRTAAQPDVERFWVDHWLPLEDEEGTVLGISVVVEEVTDLKNIEANLRKSEEGARLRAEELQALMELTPAAVWVALDPECRTITGNRAANRFYEAGGGENVSAGSAFGSEQDTTRRFFRPDGVELGPEDLPMQLAARTGQDVIDCELDVVRPSGTRMTIVGNASPLFDAKGKVRGAIAAFVDITERKRIEAELRNLAERLEQQVADRTAKVRAQADQLRALSAQLSLAEQRERKRISKVLHDELQQLIVAARIQLAAAAKGKAWEISTPEHVAQELLAEALRVTRSLTADLSPPVLEQAGLVGGLEWLKIRMKENSAFTVNLSTDSQAEPSAEDMSFLLFECVRELLLNVIKHAGVCEADVALKKNHRNQVSIVVSDRGSGFDPDLLDKRRSGDVSYGLYSIRERLAQLGGSMDIETASGHGTRVTLTIPDTPVIRTLQTKRKAPLAKRRTDTRSMTQPCRVLIVDDHKIVREGLAHLLRLEADMQVVGEASNGPEALELAAKLEPDVAIVDVNLPGMQGPEVTRRILERDPAIRIIGLSMHTDGAVAETMKEAGAAEYLDKSGPSDKLLEAIRSQMRS